MAEEGEGAAGTTAGVGGFGADAAAAEAGGALAGAGRTAGLAAGATGDIAAVASGGETAGFAGGAGFALGETGAKTGGAAAGFGGIGEEDGDAGMDGLADSTATPASLMRRIAAHCGHLTMLPGDIG